MSVVAELGPSFAMTKSDPPSPERPMASLIQPARGPGRHLLA